MRCTLLPALALLPLAACNSNRTASAPPGSYLVVLDKSDATLRMIEPNSGHVRDMASTGKGPHEAAAAPVGTLVVTSDYGDGQAPGHTLTLFDPFARHVVATVDLSPHQRPHGIAFLEQRSTVLVTSETSKALLEVDLRARKVLRAIPTGGETTHMLALAPDHRRVFTANIGSGTISAIDLPSGTLVKTVETGRQPEAIAVSPDGNELWVGHNQDDKIVVLDAHTLERRAEIPCGPMPIRIAFVPNGKLALVSCARSGEVAVIDRAARKEKKRIALPRNKLTPEQQAAAPEQQAAAGNPLPVGVLCEPNGGYAFVACMNANKIAVIDLAKLELRGFFDTGKQPDGLTWLYYRHGYDRPGPDVW